MKTYEDKNTRLELRRGVLENINCKRSTFDFVAGSSSTTPKNRPLIRSIDLQNVVVCCGMWGAVIEDLKLDSMKRASRFPMSLHACVFKHVKLSGPINGFKMNPEFDSDESVNRKWDIANREYYKDVDWALDIREAEFKGSVSFEVVPGRLILRDKQSQVLVEREKLMAADWTKVVGGTAVGIAIEWFLDRSPFDDCVLVASKRTKYFHEELQLLEKLRYEGLAI